MATKSEISANVLTIRIGPRINWLSFFTACLVLFILFGAGMVPAWEQIRINLQTGGGITGYVLGIIVLVSIAIFILAVQISAIFGSETIILTPKELQIQFRILGWLRSNRGFPNSTVEKLRFEKWWSGARGTSVQHGLRFDCVGETVTFARNATTAKCYDILDQMQRIYPFPMAESTEDDSSPAVTHW